MHITSSVQAGAQLLAAAMRDPAPILDLVTFWDFMNDSMNLELSLYTTRLIDAQQNTCFRNAMLALLRYAELAPWLYVEGWAISKEFPYEHGWLITPEREIVDPTLALFGQRYVHTRYFPGVSFSREDVAHYYRLEHLLAGILVTPLSYTTRWNASAHEAARVRAYNAK